MKKPDYSARIVSATEKLRRVPLSKRTSTYIEGSDRQRQGLSAEVLARDWLQKNLIGQGLNWSVLTWQEARANMFGDMSSAWEAITNSQNGDLYVYTGPDLLFSVEVKSSDKFPNVSITWSELTDSSASYLLAVTKYDTWICTIDDARQHAFEVKKQGGGSYWVVPHDKIKKLDIKEIINAEEYDQRFAQTRITF